MINELNQTPKALRKHIGIFGSANAGKSTLANLISGQEVSLVSDVAGTTTDPVFKPMELLPVGPVVIIDTAGLDDNTELGNLRTDKTLKQLDSCDMALYVFTPDEDEEKVKKNLSIFKERKIPVIVVENLKGKSSSSGKNFGFKTISVDLSVENSVDIVKNSIITALSGEDEEKSITADLVKAGDTVLLVMPQDSAAPKGRLIMPQVQVTRDLLDNGCIIMSVTTDKLSDALSKLKNPPDLVITDSQVFGQVNSILSKEIRLTSFSMLMAKNKGDIDEFVKGATAIRNLKDGDKVLIIENCAHHVMKDDIARIKIPMMLKKFTGKELEIVNISGQNAYPDLSDVSLVIHCGGCMINRKTMLSKQKYFEKNNIPMTNFGVALALMNGILERVVY